MGRSTDTPLSFCVVGSCINPVRVWVSDGQKEDVKVMDGLTGLKRIGMLVLAMLALVGCGNKMRLLASSSTEEKPQEPPQKPVEIPCMESSYDDENYYRALGTSSAVDMRRVRMLAYKDAQQRLKMKIANDSETEITINADVICEEVMINAMNGTYEGYVVLEIAKDSIRPTSKNSTNEDIK